MKPFRIVLAIALVALAGLLLAHEKSWTVPKEAAEKKNPVAPSPKALKDAKTVYEKECAICHGPKGDGKGAGAVALSEKPADFTDAAMMKEMTDGEIFYKVSEGRMPMPGFKAKLSEEQRWGLVNYVRTFAGKAKGAPSKK